MLNVNYRAFQVATAARPKHSKYGQFVEQIRTEFGAIYRKQFDVLPTLISGQMRVEVFNSIISLMDTHIKQNTLESKLLTKLRNFLTFKLSLGRVRPKDFEKVIEIAV